MFKFKTMKFIIPSILISLGISNPAHAYLDPGSAMLAVQAVIAAIATVLVATKIYWQQLKVFIKKLFKTKQK